MSKNVMQRIFLLIDEQDADLREWLKDVLKVERAFLANADKGIMEKLHNDLTKFIKGRDAK